MNQTQPTTHNLPEYSVSEISGVIKKHMEDRFGYVRVRGEISGFKVASSGHAYFKLKDDNAVLDGVCWRGSLTKMQFKPEDGLECVASGRITTYPGRSNYQIIVDKMEPAGAGALMALLEERKKKLAKEGLFDEDRKKPLPFLPETIGIITSPTGAVIQDILHRLEERFPMKVLLWPVVVQGQDAAPQIAAAIHGFNQMPDRPDLLIVARGGGSIEDLWAFNEEEVARATAASEIPLISAVGHETDTTLIDFVSDKRAPTPSAAVEMAVPVRDELALMVEESELRLKRSVHQLMEQKQLNLTAILRGLPKPANLMELAQQRLDNAAERLGHALPNWLDRKKEMLAGLSARLTPNLLLKDVDHQQQQIQQLEQRATRAVKMLWKHKNDALEQQARLLASVSHESVLKRGFALVQNEAGALVSSAKQAEKQERMQLTFADGMVKVAKEK